MELGDQENARICALQHEFNKGAYLRGLTAVSQFSFGLPGGNLASCYNGSVSDYTTGKLEHQRLYDGSGFQKQRPNALHVANRIVYLRDKHGRHSKRRTGPTGISPFEPPPVFKTTTLGVSPVMARASEAAFNKAVEKKNADIVAWGWGEEPGEASGVPNPDGDEDGNSVPNFALQQQQPVDTTAANDITRRITEARRTGALNIDTMDAIANSAFNTPNLLANVSLSTLQSWQKLMDMLPDDTTVSPGRPGYLTSKFRENVRIQAVYAERGVSSIRRKTLQVAIDRLGSSPQIPQIQRVAQQVAAEMDDEEEEDELPGDNQFIHRDVNIDPPDLYEQELPADRQFIQNNEQALPPMQDLTRSEKGLEVRIQTMLNRGNYQGAMRFIAAMSERNPRPQFAAILARLRAQAIRRQEAAPNRPDEIAQNHPDEVVPNHPDEVALDHPPDEAVHNHPDDDARNAQRMRLQRTLDQLRALAENAGNESTGTKRKRSTSERTGLIQELDRLQEELDTVEAANSRPNSDDRFTDPDRYLPADQELGDVFKQQAADELGQTAASDHPPNAESNQTTPSVEIVELTPAERANVALIQKCIHGSDYKRALQFIHSLRNTNQRPEMKDTLNQLEQQLPRQEEPALAAVTPVTAADLHLQQMFPTRQNVVVPNATVKTDADDSDDDYVSADEPLDGHPPNNKGSPPQAPVNPLDVAIGIVRAKRMSSSKFKAAVEKYRSRNPRNNFPVKGKTTERTTEDTEELIAKSLLNGTALYGNEYKAMEAAVKSSNLAGEVATAIDSNTDARQPPTRRDSIVDSATKRTRLTPSGDYIMTTNPMFARPQGKPARKNLVMTNGSARLVDSAQSNDTNVTETRGTPKKLAFSPPDASKRFAADPAAYRRAARIVSEYSHTDHPTMNKKIAAFKAQNPQLSDQRIWSLISLYLVDRTMPEARRRTLDEMGAYTGLISAIGASGMISKYDTSS